MSVIYDVDLETAKNCGKFNLTTKIDGKKHKVYLKLHSGIEDIQESIELCRKRKDILLVEYQGDILALEKVKNNGVQINFVEEVGNNLTSEHIDNILSDFPSGLTLVLKLPNDFNNLELVYKLNKKYPNVRYLGGNLFRLRGLKVGSFGEDLLESKGIKVPKHSYLVSKEEDILPCYSDLDIEYSERSEKEVKDIVTKKRSTSPKAKRPSSSRFAVTGFSLGDF